MKNLLALSLFIFLAFTAKAQSGINGNLSDSTTTLGVKLASVTVLRAADSTLVTFARTDAQGDYSIELPSSGEYLVVYAHPSFVGYVNKVLVGNEMKNLGNQYVITRAKMLSEVIVRQKGNVFIKGDTLEYLIDSIKLDESANVEDLLKVLPGMEIDADGNITAQGEKVEKVLVDGEEFFGNDPTMVTRNLNANIVKKVQVYEKQSKEAEFTGIDDGNSQKTIDIKLKDDMNKGMFGKVSLHGGLDDIWDNMLMVNSFKGKRKWNLYGIASSTGESGVNWRDLQKYGVNSRRSWNDGEMIFMSEDDISYNGQGLPKSWNLGTNYFNRWNEKHELKMGTSYKKMNLTTQDSSYNFNFLENGDDFANINTDDAFGTKSRVDAFVEYEWKIDSLTSIGINANADILYTRKEQNEVLQNKLPDQTILSENNTQSQYKDTTLSYNVQAYIKRKLNKPGRTISMYYNNNSKDQKFLQNKNLFIDYNGEVSQSNQLISGTGQSYRQGLKLSYTEPLYKEIWLLKLEQSYEKSRAISDYSTLAAQIQQSTFTKYDSLSNDFIFDQNTWLTDVSVQYQTKKIRSTIGTGVGLSSFEKKDYLRPINNQVYDRMNFFPMLRFRYSFNQFKQIRFRYSGSTNQPSVNQLQETYDYTNPLNIVIGNPALDQEYSQSAQLNYWSYDAFKDRSLWAGMNYTNIIDRISNITTFQPTLGRSITTYKNLDGFHSVNQWLGAHYKIKESNWKLGQSLNSNYFIYPFETNGVSGSSSTFTISPNFTVRYSIEKKLDARLDLSATHTSTKSELRNLDNKYWTFDPEMSITYRPVDFIKIRTDINYLRRQKTPPFLSDFQQTIWNAELSGYLDQEKRIELRITAHDILNQNNGYRRSSQNNMVEERYYLTLKRYFMLGLSYNFAVGPIAKKENPGGDDAGGHF